MSLYQICDSNGNSTHDLPSSNIFAELNNSAMITSGVPVKTFTIEQVQSAIGRTYNRLMSNKYIGALIRLGGSISGEYLFIEIYKELYGQFNLENQKIDIYFQRNDWVSLGIIISELKSCFPDMIVVAKLCVPNTVTATTLQPFIHDVYILDREDMPNNEFFHIIHTGTTRRHMIHIG